MKSDPDACSITRFFVYGTLCRDQCREHCWPVRPKNVFAAWVFGSIHGRADYPAMRPGDDRVAGECWEFETSDMPAVVHALDIVEGTDQPGIPNLYDRVTVEVFSPIVSDPSVWAYGYHYATDPAEDGFVKIAADAKTGYARWPSLS